MSGRSRLLSPAAAQIRAFQQKSNIFIEEKSIISPHVANSNNLGGLELLGHPPALSSLNQTISSGFGMRRL
jgi:hypothetical protein